MPFLRQETRESSEFCPQCGTTLEKQEHKGPEPLREANKAGHEGTSKKKRSWILIGVGTLVVLAVATALIYFLLVAPQAGETTEDSAVKASTGEAVSEGAAWIGEKANPQNNYFVMEDGPQVNELLWELDARARETESIAVAGGGHISHRVHRQAIRLSSNA